MQAAVAVLGTMDYGEALALQEKLLRLRQQGAIPDTLLLLEHPPSLTLGRHADPGHIVLPEETLAARGVVTYRVNRGGDVTYHGPGQVVGYPIIDLRQHGREVPLFFRRLEEVFIRLLGEEYGIDAGRDERYPGVWVGGSKITAIGCAIKRWVTMHGFAFNVNTDLEHFRWIIPCGIAGRGVTSLEKLCQGPQDLEQVTRQVIRHFCRVFDLEAEVISKEILYQIAGRDEDDAAETGLAED